MEESYRKDSGGIPPLLVLPAAIYGVPVKCQGLFSALWYSILITAFLAKGVYFITHLDTRGNAA